MNNDELNLVEILKDVPQGTTFYCTLYGDVQLVAVKKWRVCPIVLYMPDGTQQAFPSNGHFDNLKGGECVIFPSKENRDWSTYKYTPPQPKEEFKPYDRVLVRNDDDEWEPQFFSHISHYNKFYPYATMDDRVHMYCISYEGNEHLAFTKDVPKNGEE